MRGLFSIEWLAQSSQSSPAKENIPAPLCTRISTEPTTPETHSDDRSDFLCRTRTETQINQESPEVFSHGHKMCLPHQRGPLTVYNELASETGFSSGTEEETSGYESEGGRSLSPAITLSSVSSTSLSGRMPRTAFTSVQINSLERSFKKNAYLGTQDKTELCKKLNLSDKQIRNWFQNRRMKLKRSVQVALAHTCQANVSSHLMHYPEVQAYNPNANPRYHPHTAVEETSAAPYLQSHYLLYRSPTPTSATPSFSALPLDSLYRYSSLPAMVSPTRLIGAYQPNPY